MNMAFEVVLKEKQYLRQYRAVMQAAGKGQELAAETKRRVKACKRKAEMI
jgi:hypothetical protein